MSQNSKITVKEVEYNNRTYYNVEVTVSGRTFPVQVCYGGKPHWRATQFLVDLVRQAERKED